MKRVNVFIFILLLVTIIISACGSNKENVSNVLPKVAYEEEQTEVSKSKEALDTRKEEAVDKIVINIIVQGQTFTATLDDNDTAKSFASMLPLTIDMEDINGNEKYYVLPETIRQENAKNPGSIHVGDLKCYGDAGLVLFYDSFPTTYNYVSIGHIENSEGLADVLGSGNVEVTFTQQ